MQILVKDRTTNMNIIWATDTYADHPGCSDTEQIDPMKVWGLESVNLAPRINKSADEQQARTRKKAEVFTPVWICNDMNNYADEEWFGRNDVFNHPEGHDWTVSEKPIEFPEGKTWKDYVDSRRLEITCGEAPFLVSRYDAATGELILPPLRRIGMLERKLRVVNENTETYQSWFVWTKRAFQSCYGYEYQGDNLLIARINLMQTFTDYYCERWGKVPSMKAVTSIAKIISWNLWQMDGLSDTVPRGKPGHKGYQMDLFQSEKPDKDSGVKCNSEKSQFARIKDWRTGESMLFHDLKQERGNMSKKLFDFCIGNPPYQEDTESDSTRMLPVYDKFMDAANDVSTVVELITPARFLFNAGQTSKSWNQKMLNDTHFKVLSYEQNATKIFPNTDIKGGVAVTYRNSNKEYGKIGVFVPYPELRAILKKAGAEDIKDSLTDIADSSNVYDLHNIYADHPDYKKYIGDNGRHSQLKTNVLNINPIFTNTPTEADDYAVLGLVNGKRGQKYCHRRYLKTNHKSLHKYKVLIPKATGSGKFGDTFSEMIVARPEVAFTQTYISIGTFDNESEAVNLLKYLKTKFCRSLLFVLKVTQDNLPSVWRYIPKQNFNDHSDIDWSQSIADIDRQLYRKYDLTKDEIDFIETHVKEME